MMGYLVLLLVCVCTVAQAHTEYSRVLRRGRQESDPRGDLTKEPNFEVYQSYREITDTLRYFEDTFPDKNVREIIGTSYEGRALEIVKVSTDHSATDRPIVFVIGNMHAREWAANAAILYSINKLLHGSYDVLQKVDFHFLPLANPDGYEFSRNGDPTDCSDISAARMWRKTRSPTKNPGCIGVDGNRNFPFMFGHDDIGASIDPCASDYRGEKAKSEVEVRAVVKHLTTTENIQGFISVHTYSQVIMWPYGYKANLTTDEEPENFDELATVANDIENAMTMVNGNNYTSQVSSDMYPASGTSVDFAKSIGVRLTFTFEMSPATFDFDTFGFCLPENQIKGTGDELFAGLMTVAEVVSGASTCMSPVAVIVLTVGCLMG